MFSIAAVAIVHAVQEDKFGFDFQKVQQAYNDYTRNYHAGLTLVMGYPFEDAEFRKHVQQEQNAIRDVFRSFDLESLLTLYDVDSQVHATLIELASQHDKEKIDQQFLTEEELCISSKTKNIMNI